MKHILQVSIMFLMAVLFGCGELKNEELQTQKGNWHAVDSIKVELIGNIIPLDYLASKDWYLAANYGKSSFIIFDGSGKVIKELNREEGSPNDWGYPAGSGFFGDSLILVQGNNKGIFLYDFDGKKAGEIPLPFMPGFGSWTQDKKFFMLDDNRMLIEFPGRHDFMEQNKGGYPFPLFEHIDINTNESKSVITLPRSSKYAIPERRQMLYYAYTFWNSQFVLAPENDTFLYVYNTSNDAFEMIKEVELPIKTFVAVNRVIDESIDYDKIMLGEIEHLLPVGDKLFVFYFAGMDQNKMESLGLGDDYWKNLEYKVYRVMVLDSDFNVLDDLELPDYIYHARFAKPNGQILFNRNIYKMGEDDDSTWFYLMEYR
jgi:hypothetical protein